MHVYGISHQRIGNRDTSSHLMRGKKGLGMRTSTESIFNQNFTKFHLSISIYINLENRRLSTFYMHEKYHKKSYDVTNVRQSNERYLVFGEKGNQDLRSFYLDAGELVVVVGARGRAGDGRRGWGHVIEGFADRDEELAVSFSVSRRRHWLVLVVATSSQSSCFRGLIKTAPLLKARALNGNVGYTHSAKLSRK
ncbi:uncharacterized protein A4U43_C03F26660 [Asparagus officinalis]|uniref:Uncharacterized protein n=1 Tax=Asparagus officinalis TaxID=4686 RepID=A0A5P1FHH8_ASPOF|nr:uncharacterized protein A4U43_C03F26660 [Asparagus officinalis]